MPSPCVCPECIVYGCPNEPGNDGLCATHGAQARHRSGRSRTHNSWEAMFARCTRPSHRAFHHYAGRGITICERWRNFDNFLADMGERPARKTLDRIDNSRGYEPGNCRWATMRQQLRNTRANRYVSAFGATATIAEWSELSGIKVSAIRQRLSHGWSPDAAVGEPLHATVRRGERSPTAKLTDTNVREVRRCAASGEPVAALAHRFAVSPRTIDFIVSRRNWAHLPDEPDALTRQDAADAAEFDGEPQQIEAQP